MPSPTTLGVTDLTVRRPDGVPILDGLTFTLGPGRHGLVGDNGAGKSTLLAVLAGKLAPSSGGVHVAGETGLLPQDPAADPRLTVAGLLGVEQTVTALAAIERGSVRPADFDAVGDDWDVAERVEAMLDRVGLADLALDRPATSLSGGELVLTSLVGLLLRRPSVLLLDEPTNTLDARARQRLVAVLDEFPGVLVVVSHDRGLLARVDSVGELRGGRLGWYGGNLEHYEQAVAVEQRAAEQAASTARAEVRRRRRELVDQQTKQARRDRRGRGRAENQAPIIAHAEKRRAQETAGRLTAVHRDRLEEARQFAGEAERRVRDGAEIRIDLPDTRVPARREVLRAEGLASAHGAVPLDLMLRGPERVALTGPNGVGKTSLLRCLAGEERPVGGTGEILVPHQMLPQNPTPSDPGRSVLEAVRAAAPTADPARIRHQLALFLFRGEEVHQPVGTLSGGEQRRARLARLLLADPAPQLLILDEPTDDLDFAGVRHLVQALRAHQGALLVVSHDEDFLEQLALDRRLLLTREGVEERGGDDAAS
ncbi:ABC-F family ATP-binding cassette domain-containing protein [Nesterenkonia sp. F]|uniref:ABC-F family ATP-binding cassette domain-containing protein n=1 Tax=Nesterenkonia sp. F TaxID=795955 RepID=UPI000255C7D0|nr:ATP-binding cassette domain-containing protein [Nesterenkonia sp. F]